MIAATICWLLSGCALPPVLTYISYAKTSGDVVSYVETEKTLTDHAISYAANKDCALLRVFDADEDICVEVSNEQ